MMYQTINDFSICWLLLESFNSIQITNIFQLPIYLNSLISDNKKFFIDFLCNTRNLMHVHVHASIESYVYSEFDNDQEEFCWSITQYVCKSLIRRPSASFVCSLHNLKSSSTLCFHYTIQILNSQALLFIMFKIMWKEHFHI